MQEFVPKGLDSEADVLETVSCLVQCVLKSKSNNGCFPYMCAVHYIHTVKAIAFC